MKLWQLFETEVLDDLEEGSSFTARQLGEAAALDTTEASRWITLYVDAQRRPRSRTKYVLHRTGRTASAVWSLGVRTNDARDIVGQFGDDTRYRLFYAVRPDLQRIAKKNGRSTKAIEEQLSPAIDGVVQIIGAMMSVAGWTAEDELDGASR